MNTQIARYIIYICILFLLKANANPLLNANPEDYTVYDNLNASKNADQFSLTNMPFSAYRIAPFIDNYDRVKLNLNANDDTGFYVKPINSITAKFFMCSENNSFIEGQSGLSLLKGANFFIFADGLLSAGENFVLYYQVKQTVNDDRKNFELFRAYAKMLFYKFSFEGGIDNVNLGPGEYGLLLSNNATPYPMVKLQTEDHLNIFGKMDFLIMHGWLTEDRDDCSNPYLFAMRFIWKPFNFIELGATRTILYKGDDRPGFTIQEYPDLIAGTKENTGEEKFDNDAYLGYDISLFLPLYKIIKSVKISKLYYQEACTDINAPWQENYNGTWKVYFYERAFQIGYFMSTENSIFRIEYVTTAQSFYSHRYYNIEGYTYNDLSLGYPYGRNIQSLMLKYKYYFVDTFSLEYRMGVYQQPAFDSMDISPRGYFDPLKPSSDIDENMERRYFCLQGNYRIWNFIIECYLRYDITNNYDTDILPTQYTIEKKNETFYTVGASVSYRI